MAGKAATRVVTSATGATSIQARVPAVAREQTQSRQTNAIQQHAADATAPIRSGPRADGTTTLAAVSFTSGQTVTLSHRLGRAYVGWHAHSAKGHAPTLYETTTADKTKFLVLVNDSANAFTCDIEVW